MLNKQRKTIISYSVKQGEVLAKPEGQTGNGESLLEQQIYYYQKGKMDGYLGETRLEIRKTKYSLYSKPAWALFWIEMYGGIDGAYHRDWLIDQIARILNGTKVIVKIAKWANGKTEERFSLDKPSKKYWGWVKKMKTGEDGKDTYLYDFGIAP